MVPTKERPRGWIDPSAPWPLRALMAVYRFLASVKLAVISIAALAAVLAYGTWFESRHGGPAVQEYVYQSMGFSILLAFLAINILCAALIRIPWKRRQTGFVVTHLGLLILIAGSWVGFQYSDEGQAGAPEGGVIDKLIRFQEPMIRVRPLNKETRAPEGEFEIPFKGGAFDWAPGKFEVISHPKDPFKVAVKAYYPTARPRRVHVAAKDGTPMLRLKATAKPPGAAKPMPLFETTEEEWFVISSRTTGYRVSRQAGPAKFAFLFADRAEVIDDFLNPPKNPGDLGVARLHYVDKAGQPRTFEVRADDARAGQEYLLPESDLVATFVSADRQTTDDPDHVRQLGDTEISMIEFKIRRGSGPEVSHRAFAEQPTIPPVGRKDERLATIYYFRPPTLGGAGMMGNFGLVEVLGDPSGALHYRVFGRDETPTPPGETKKAKTGVLKKAPATLKIGEDVVAFGGNPNLPMTLSFRAEEYLVSGEDKIIYEPFELPVGQRGNGLAAALLEMTVDGVTKDVWVHRPPGLDKAFTTVRFPSGDYQVGYDCDRKDLGFSFTLDDFDVQFDPGTSQPSAYTSEVTLNDEAKKIKGKPVRITMNEPMTHREYTFYQSSYERLRDPESGRENGEFQSVFQVGYDAGRFLKYLGCGLVVLGAFLQFYMRAGLFTDGGKAEREAAAEKARLLLNKKAEPVQQATSPRPKKSKKPRHHDSEIL